MRNSSVEKLLCAINAINGVLLVLSTFFQLLALISGVLLNDKNSLTQRFPWLVPVWGSALILLVVAHLLNTKLADKHPWPTVAFVGALMGTFGALMVVLALRDTLSSSVGGYETTQGLTVWKLLYRHASSVLVGLLTAIVAAVRWYQCRFARIQAEKDALKSAGSTIGLDSFAGDNSLYEKPKKLKRSLRIKAKKATEETAE